MGIGSGIVYDSTPEEEHAECKLKASFLTSMHDSFSLFETMHTTKADGYRYCDLHLRRLRASAIYFGFSYDEKSLRKSLQSHCADLIHKGAYKTRLTLSANGNCRLQCSALEVIKSPVKLLLSKNYVESEQLFLRHKTTFRKRYDQAWQEAQNLGAFDMLFFNQKGELTEGARSNVFLKLKGRWYTPKLSSGLLPGVMRRVILSDPKWGARECILKIEDLLKAEKIIVCNALHGPISATLSHTMPTKSCPS
jgi:para-aminobenzoate synthetase/4-amino-4-deoxychorismate lyase